MYRKNRLGRLFICMLVLASLPACTAIAVTSAVVGTVASVAVEVVEIPFEVAGAAYDLATDDDEAEERED
jgi:hypothetical protein